MKNSRRFLSAAARLSAAGLLGAATLAHADGGRYDSAEVYWSIAMAQPGLRVAVTNAPMAPVWVGYGPVHYHIHRPAPVIVPPPQVVVLPPPPPPGWHHGHGHHKHRHGYPAVGYGPGPWHPHPGR